MAGSWVSVPEGSDFPLENLPFCQFQGGAAVRIGDHLVSLRTLAASGLVSGEAESYESLQAMLLSGLGHEDVRRQAQAALSDGASPMPQVLTPIAECRLELPLRPRAFVDFYSGIHHASNVGKMFRPDQPALLPNYRHVPIGYNGRASSVVVSGVDVHRPNVQTRAGDSPPEFGPTRELDFELEMGFFLAKGTEMGSALDARTAWESVFGLVIVNDWSARDTQRWEYQPLGPFLAKSFGTSISPYVVTPEALRPFRVAGIQQEPPPLPHLATWGPTHYDVTLEVWLQSRAMLRPQKICSSNMKHLYWSMVQQLAHQSSNGTPLEVGDLYASGTISGESEGSYGSMLELTWRGTKPLALEETGETRTFLEDGDIVTMRAYTTSPYRIGFGEVAARIVR